MPTTLRSSPTATRAVKEKRRPPLTTLATRLISITRSCRSRPCGLTVLYSRSRLIGSKRVDSSKFQAALARAFRERGAATVVAVAATIEHTRLDAGVGGALGEELAGLLRLLAAIELSELVLGPRDGGERLARVVVDQLSGDAPIGAEYRDARPLRRPAHFGANPTAAAKTLLSLGLYGHAYALFPTLRRTCSPA